MKIIKYKHGDAGLWDRIGLFLASRTVHAELGGPLYSTETTTWFVAVDGNETIGFASLRQEKSAIHYDYDYVVAARRSQGVFSKLAAARDAAAREFGLPVQTMICKPRWRGHREHGWKKLSERGQWIRAGKEKP